MVSNSADPDLIEHQTWFLPVSGAKTVLDPLKLSSSATLQLVTPNGSVSLKVTDRHTPVF